MSKAAVLALLLAAGCSKPTPEKACKHVIDLSIKEIDRTLEHLQDGGMTSMQGSMVAKKKELQSRREADVEKCVTKVEAADVDLSCLMDADKLDQVLGCFGK